MLREYWTLVVRLAESFDLVGFTWIQKMAHLPDEFVEAGFRSRKAVQPCDQFLSFSQSRSRQFSRPRSTCAGRRFFIFVLLLAALARSGCSNQSRFIAFSILCCLSSE